MRENKHSENYKGNIITKTIKIAEILKINGVDLNKISLTHCNKKGRRFITLGEVKQDGINIDKIIRENNLNGEFYLGLGIATLRQTYRGNLKYKMTEEEKRKAEELNLIKKTDKLQETAEILEILKKNGVNINELVTYKKVKGNRKGILLKDIDQDGIDIEDIIRKNKLSRNFPICERIIYLNSQMKKGKIDLDNIGFEKKENMITRFLRIATILKENGVNITEIPISRYDSNHNKNFTLLKDINQKGIDIEDIIRKNKLKRDYKWGVAVTEVRKRYKGKSMHGITEEEKRKVEELGVLGKETVIAQTIKISKILKENGVKIYKIKLKVMRDGDLKYILLKEIKQEGIDIEKIIKENNLDGDFPWGQRFSNMKSAYKGKTTSKMTESQKKEVEELGLVTNLKNRKQEKIDAISKNEEARKLYEEYEKFATNDIIQE